MRIRVVCFRVNLWLLSALRRINHEITRNQFALFTPARLINRSLGLRWGQRINPSRQADCISLIHQLMVSGTCFDAAHRTLYPGGDRGEYDQDISGVPERRPEGAREAVGRAREGIRPASRGIQEQPNPAEFGRHAVSCAAAARKVGLVRAYTKIPRQSADSPTNCFPSNHTSEFPLSACS